MIRTRFALGQKVLIHKTSIDSAGLRWTAEDSGIVSGVYHDPRSVPFYESYVKYTVRFGPKFGLEDYFSSADLKETPND